MAVNPFSISTLVTWEDAALSLSGIDRTIVNNGGDIPKKNLEYRKWWKRELFWAVQNGELQATAIQVHHTDEGWQTCTIEKAIERKVDLKDLSIIFDRSELQRWLMERGIGDDEIPDVLRRKLLKSEAKTVPWWMRIYAGKRGLTLDDAAAILVDHEPHPGDNWADNEEQAAWQNLFDLIRCGDLTTIEHEGHDSSQPGTWLIDHRSIAVWCERLGIEWPLSHLMPPAQTEGTSADASTPHASQQDQDELNQELVALRQEVADLRTTVEELKRSVPLHPGGNMGKAIEVQHKYWQDPDSNRPKAAVIVAEMKDKYPELSDANANAIEKVACPINRKR